MRWWDDWRERLPLIAFGAFWLLFPAVIVWNAAAVELRCKRAGPARPTCTLTTSHDLRATGQLDFPAAELLGAEVEETTDSEGDTNYRLVLQLERGPLPFTPNFTSGRDEKEANADRVRQFVTDRAQPSLVISEDNRLTSYLIAGVMAAILIFVGTVIVRGQ